jgi:hypothetical protein
MARRAERSSTGHNVTTMDKGNRQLPAWLVGFLLALIVFAVVLVALNLLGIGDDPSLGP